MKILIPMAGAGKRFSDAGYTTPKPLIPTTYLKDGKQYPMVVCAVKDVEELKPAGEESEIIFVYRSDRENSSVVDMLNKSFENVKIVGVDYLTEGQACTCLLAKEYIDKEESLFIAGCDNGMVADKQSFDRMTKKADVIVFTYRHNDCVLENPNAYGWVKVLEDNRITDVSVKKALSENPMEDHAIVASFWFKKGSDFVSCTEEMIAADDRINNEFYVDKVIKYCLLRGLKVYAYEIERYLGWGTPRDYEMYEKTVSYWREFTCQHK